MIAQDILQEIETFETTALQSTMRIIKRIDEELMKAEDIMQSKVQALHRLFLSFMRQYHTLKKKKPADAPMDETRSSRKKKSSTNKKKQNRSLHPTLTQVLESKDERNQPNSPDNPFTEQKNVPTGLLCYPNLNNR